MAGNICLVLQHLTAEIWNARTYSQFNYTALLMYLFWHYCLLLLNIKVYRLHALLSLSDMVILFVTFCKILFSSVILSKSMCLMHNIGAHFKQWRHVILRERSINASESLLFTLVWPSPRAAAGIMTLVSWGLRRKSGDVDADTGDRCLFTVWSRLSTLFKARKRSNLTNLIVQHIR